MLGHTECLHVQVITPGGGALNLLFRLQHKPAERPGHRVEGADGGVLGKLDIKWRTTMGDVGRLQTQPISATAAALKDIQIQVAESTLGARTSIPFMLCTSGFSGGYISPKLNKRELQQTIISFLACSGWTVSTGSAAWLDSMCRLVAGLLGKAQIHH